MTLDTPICRLAHDDDDDEPSLPHRPANEAISVASAGVSISGGRGCP